MIKRNFITEQVFYGHNSRKILCNPKKENKEENVSVIMMEILNPS